MESEEKVTIYISYTEKDQSSYKEFRRFLQIEEETVNVLISTHSESENDEADNNDTLKKLPEAHLIIFFLSNNLLNCKNVNSREIPQAEKLWETKGTRTIIIFHDDCDYRSAGFNDSWLKTPQEKAIKGSGASLASGYSTAATDIRRAVEEIKKNVRHQKKFEEEITELKKDIEESRIREQNEIKNLTAENTELNTNMKDKLGEVEKLNTIIVNLNETKSQKQQLEKKISIKNWILVLLVIVLLITISGLISVFFDKTIYKFIYDRFFAFIIFS